MWPEHTLNGSILHTRKYNTNEWDEIVIPKSQNSFLRGIAWALYPLFRPIDILISTFRSKTNAYKSMKADILTREQEREQARRTIQEKERQQAIENDTYAGKVKAIQERNYEQSGEILLIEHKEREGKLRASFSQFKEEIAIDWQSNPEQVTKYCAIFGDSAESFIILQMAMLKQIEASEIYQSLTDEQAREGFKIKCLIDQPRFPEDKLMYAYLFMYASLFDVYHFARSFAKQALQEYDGRISEQPASREDYTEKSKDTFFNPRHRLYEQRCLYNACMRYFYVFFGNNSPSFKEHLDGKLYKEGKQGDTRFTNWTHEDTGDSFRANPDTRPT
jgi:hypothetical protein